MTLTLTTPQQPDAEFGYTVAALRARISGLAELQDIGRITTVMEQQMKERGQTWTWIPGNPQRDLICDWIEALHPELYDSLKVFDWMGDKILRIFGSEVGDWMEFPLPPVLGGLDDEVVRRIDDQLVQVNAASRASEVS